MCTQPTGAPVLVVRQGVGTGLSERGLLSLWAEESVKSDCSARKIGPCEVGGKLKRVRKPWHCGSFDSFQT